MPWKRSEVRRLASVTSPWRSTSASRSLSPCSRPPGRAAARPGGRPGPPRRRRVAAPAGSPARGGAMPRESRRAPVRSAPAPPRPPPPRGRPPSDGDLDRILGRVVVGVGLPGDRIDLDPQRALLAEHRGGRAGDLDRRRLPGRDLVDLRLLLVDLLRVARVEER